MIHPNTSKGSHVRGGFLFPSKLEDQFKKVDKSSENKKSRPEGRLKNKSKSHEDLNNAKAIVPAISVSFADLSAIPEKAPKTDRPVGRGRSYSIPTNPTPIKLSPKNELRRNPLYFEQLDFSVQESIEVEEERKEFDDKLVANLKEKLNFHDGLFQKVEKVVKEQFLILLYEDIGKETKGSSIKEKKDPFGTWQKFVNNSQLIKPIAERLTICRQRLVDYINEKNVETVWAESLLKFLNEFLTIPLNTRSENSKEQLSINHSKKNLLYQAVLQLEMGCLVEKTQELLHHVFDGPENYLKILKHLKIWQNFEDFKAKLLKEKIELQKSLKRISKAKYPWMENPQMSPLIHQIDREKVIKDTWSSAFRRVFVNGEQIDILGAVFQDPVYSEKLENDLTYLKIGDKMADLNQLEKRKETLKRNRKEIFGHLKESEISGAEMRLCLFNGESIKVKEPKPKSLILTGKIDWCHEFLNNEILKFGFLGLEKSEQSRFDILKSFAAISKHELFNEKRKQVLENVIKGFFKKGHSKRALNDTMNFHMKCISLFHTKVRQQFLEVIKGDEYLFYYFKKQLEILQKHSFDGIGKKDEEIEIELLADLLVSRLEPRLPKEYPNDFKDMYKQFFKIKSLLNESSKEQNKPLIKYLFYDIERERKIEISQKLQILLNQTRDVENLFADNHDEDTKKKFLKRLEPFLKHIGKSETIFDLRSEEEKNEIFNLLRLYLEREIEKDEALLGILNKLSVYSEKMKKLWGFLRLTSPLFWERVGEDHSRQVFQSLFTGNFYTIPIKKRNLSIGIQDEEVMVEQKHFYRTFKANQKREKKHDTCQLSLNFSWKAPLIVNNIWPQIADLGIAHYKIKTTDAVERRDIINHLLKEEKN